jgi:5-carboxymethyl-2-hydroxymuconate isomerase
MPHLILEISDNVEDRPDLKKVLMALHSALVETGLFALEDIKSRVIRHEVFAVGDGRAERAFVALSVQILGGRSDGVKASISGEMLGVLERFFPLSLRGEGNSITVQVVDIHRASYQRRLGSEA